MEQDRNVSEEFPFRSQVIEIGEIKPSTPSAKDPVSRRYQVVGFRGVGETMILGGKEVAVFDDTPARYKVLWEKGPNGSRGNLLFDQLHIGAPVKAVCGTADVEDYYIESPNGKYTHPDTGKSANRASTYSYVRFPYESVDQILAQNGLVRRGAPATHGDQHRSIVFGEESQKDSIAEPETKETVPA